MGFEEEGTGDFVLAPMVDDEQLKNMITYSYTSQNNVRFPLEKSGNADANYCKFCCGYLTASILLCRYWICPVRIRIVL